MKRRNKDKLPPYGVGPLYVGVVVILTALGYWADHMGLLDSGKVPALKIPFLILGIALIAFGLFLWGSALFVSKIDDGIKNNCLVTTGVYGYVRNPIYSAWLMFGTGAVLFRANLWLLLFPLIFWGWLTVALKMTEEKWLSEMFQLRYKYYCYSVNRCIPWFPRKFKLDD